MLRDLDLIKTFPGSRVSFSINTLDEGFRREMDRAAPIERRLAAMKALYEAGVRTVCQLAPIFPGITDVEAIVRRVRGICNLVWLENLNLRGDYKARILAWVHEKRPDLDPLYDAIYRRGDRTYWAQLDARLRDFAAAENLPYLRAVDDRMAAFGEPPVVVNYFYHGQVRKSARQNA